MVKPVDDRVGYLESGGDGGESEKERLDLIRSVLANEATWAEPSSGIIEAIGAAIGTTEPAKAAPARRRWGLVAAAVTAVSLAVVGLAWAGLLESGPEIAVTAAMLGTDLAPDAVGTATLEETPSGWWIRLDVDGLPPAPLETYYEGWVWDEGLGVSIGTFHLRGGSEPVVLWAGVDVAEYPSIWVTLQDEGAGPETSERVMMMGDIAGLSR